MHTAAPLKFHILALPCVYAPATSPTTHHRCTSSHRRPWDSLKLALYIRIYLGKEKEANGCGLYLKNRSLHRQSPRPARGSHVVHKPHVKRKNKPLYFQIQAEHTILVQGQLFLVYNFKRRETKALLFCLGMQIARMSFPVVFSTP